MRTRRTGIRVYEMVALIALISIPTISRAAGDAPPGPGDWLGVSVKPVSDALRQAWEYRGNGLLVTEVEPGSAAEQTGIVRGDLLVIVGPVTLKRVDDLARAKDRVDPEQSFSVVVERNHGRMIKVMSVDPIQQSEPAPAEAAAPDPLKLTVTAPEESITPDPAPAAADPTAVVEQAPATTEPAPVAVATPAIGAEVAAKSEKDPLAILGVTGVVLNHDLAAALNVPIERGVLISTVVSGASGERVGMRAGDVIVKAGGESVETIEALGQALEKASGTITLTVQRQKTRRDLEVALESPPTPDDSKAASQREDVLKKQIDDLKKENEKLRAEVERLKSN
jgi:membrane-associated protease RseP (regulator of RpoE activity)